MFENIRLNNPNFCIGPQTGTFCSVDSDNDPVVMHVRNTNGELIRTYGFYPPGVLESGPYTYDPAPTLNSDGYFYNEFVAIKYVGPKDQNSYFNGAVFYTLEKRAKTIRDFYKLERDLDVEGHPYVLFDEIDPEDADEISFPRPAPYEEYNLNDALGYLDTDSSPEFSSNIIRRWLLDSSNDRLVLNNTIIKNSDDTDWFGGDAFSVVNNVSSLLDHAVHGSGQIFLPLTTTSGLKKYDTLMLGPSTDQDNVGDIEEVYVHSIDGEKVVIKTYEGYIPPKYDYMEEDLVTSFGDVVLFGNPKPLVNSIGIKYGTTTPYGTLFHMDQTNYGEVYLRDYSGIYSDVHSAAWNAYMNTISFVKGGNLLHMDLDDYEISRSQCLSLMYPTTNRSIELFDIDIKDVTIYRLQEEIIKKDDAGQYSVISWSTYNYQTDSLLPYSFSLALQADNNVLMVADRANITVTVRDQFGVGLINKNIWFTTEGDSGAVIQPEDGYGQSDADGQAFLTYDAGYNVQGQVKIKALVDGGNITHGTSFVNTVINLTQHNEYSIELRLVLLSDFTSTCSVLTKSYLIPAQVKGAPSLNRVNVPACDGSVAISQRVSFMYPYNKLLNEDGWKTYSDLVKFPPLIKQIEEPVLHKENAVQLPAPGFYNNSAELYVHTNSLAFCKNSRAESEFKIQIVPEGYTEHPISQNYVSKHLLYGHTDTVALDQFVFVQEAFPKMWSEKNNVDTDYWIRLRPFASDLDPSTLIIKFREDSYLGEGVWYEVTPDGDITMFDAGGGLLGIDFYYIPPVVFHHSALVYVSIEVYDTSNIPNKILLDYWFKLIPDFKAPYIDNLFPVVEEPAACVNTQITFDCLDAGEGVDIETLEVYVNNRYTSFTYDEFEHGNYHITCIIPYDFYYGQTVNVVVDVKDRSANANRLFDGWKFYVTESTTPWFDMDSTEPVRCVRGRGRDQDVSLQVYGVDDTGIDYDSLRLEIGGRYRRIKIIPIVYRLN
jgi:hypothetical protein